LIPLPHAGARELAPCPVWSRGIATSSTNSSSSHRRTNGDRKYVLQVLRQEFNDSDGTRKCGANDFLMPTLPLREGRNFREQGERKFRGGALPVTEPLPEKFFAALEFFDPPSRGGSKALRLRGEVQVLVVEAEIGERGDRPHPEPHDPAPGDVELHIGR